MSGFSIQAVVDVMPFASHLGHIFYFIVLPILLLASLGYLLQRNLHLDMPTLTKLNFYLVAPVLVFHSVVTSNVTAGEFGQVVAFTAAMLACLAGVTYVAGRICRVDADHRTVLMMTTMFYNSGNYGLPLQDLAFRTQSLGAQAMALQVFAMLSQNLANFTIGVLLAASGRQGRHWKQNLLYMLKFPPVYALLAAVLAVQIRTLLGPDRAATAGDILQPAWQAMVYVRDAFVAVALVTMGAQLALLKEMVRKYPIALSVCIRLLGGPAIGLGLIWLFGIHGLLAQVLLISTSTPTAVNTMLLCLQFDHHPDFAVRAVVYSTLLSPITVTLVIFLAQSGLLG